MSQPVSATITISGMTCAACSARIQRALQNAPGVATASVNLMTAQATVGFDPALTSPESLTEVIRRTGYDAELPAPGRTAEQELEAQDAARAAEIAELRWKVGISLTAAVLTMVLSMPLAHEPGAAMVLDPAVRLMMPLSAALERAAPWLYHLPGDTLRWMLLWSPFQSCSGPAATSIPERGPPFATNRRT
jgi:cation transport ATPase